MTDDSKPGDTGTDPQQNQQSDEETFWQKLDKKLDDAIDRNVKKHLGNRKPGDSRTGQPTPTIPRFLAALMGGPFAPPGGDDKKE
jgi:hypothetical protein